VLDALINNDRAFDAFINAPEPLIQIFPELLTDEILQARVGLAIVPRKPIPSSDGKNSRVTADGCTMTTVSNYQNPYGAQPKCQSAVTVAERMASACKGKLHPYIPLHVVYEIVKNQWTNEEKKLYMENFDTVASKLTSDTHIAERHVDKQPAELRNRGYGVVNGVETIFSSMTIKDAFASLSQVTERALNQQFEKEESKLFIKLDTPLGYAVEARRHGNKSKQTYSDNLQSYLYDDPQKKPEHVHNDIYVLPSKGAIAYFLPIEGVNYIDPLFVKTIFPLAIDADKVTREHVFRTNSSQPFFPESYVNALNI
jgi:hypothetical protein